MSTTEGTTMRHAWIANQLRKEREQSATPVYTWRVTCGGDVRFAGDEREARDLARHMAAEPTAVAPVIEQLRVG